MKDPNIETLEIMVHHLGELSNEFLFVGGSTVGLYISDKAVPAVRATVDIDCVVEVINRGEYYATAEKLKARGFREDSSSNVICRFRKNELILDVMPTKVEILNFTNQWYIEGIKHKVSITLSNGSCIHILSTAFFIASKLEAFKGRGQGDFMSSHDIEDLITVFDGDPLVADKILKSPDNVRAYLGESLTDLLRNEDFTESIEGHINDRLNTAERAAIVKKRINASLPRAPR